jgi:hypothetical protein
MTPGREIKDRLAHALLAHAAKVGAPDHAEWIQAIAHEWEHLPKGQAALSWALGCVFVSYTGRVRAMLRSPVHWPRWLILLEMLICLGPASAYFVLISISTVQGYLLFLPTQGLTQLQEGLIFGSAALIGPVGLFAAYKTLFSHTPPHGSLMTIVLASLVAWAMTVCAGLFGYLHLEVAAWFAMYVLPFVLLPAAAVAHLRLGIAAHEGRALSKGD